MLSERQSEVALQKMVDREMDKDATVHNSINLYPLSVTSGMIENSLPPFFCYFFI